MGGVSGGGEEVFGGLGGLERAAGRGRHREAGGCAQAPTQTHAHTQQTRPPQKKPKTMQDGTILEFIGWLAASDGPKLMFRRWVCTSEERMNSILQLGNDSASLGAGTELVLAYEEVWRNPACLKSPTSDHCPPLTKSWT